MPGRATDPTLPRRADRGFSLVVVIWGLGLLTLISLTVVTTSRWRAMATGRLVGGAQASHLAEAVTNLVALKHLKTGSDGSPSNGTPLFCALPQGAIAAVVLEDENGKIDLNAASPQLLTAALKGFGVEARQADALAKAIVEFRVPAPGSIDALQRDYEIAGRPYGPKRGLFQTPLEIDQVLGMTNDIFNMILPYLTVSSQQPAVSSATAMPALFAALSGAPIDVVMALNRKPYPNALDRRNAQWPVPALQPQNGGHMTVHAEVMMPNGALATQRTLIDFRPSGSEPFSIKEVRRTGSIYRDDLLEYGKRSQDRKPLGTC
jgi:general secretion pathway protein K